MAGEIKKPVSYSYRTLEKLKSLTKKETETFCKIASLSFKISNTWMVYRDNELLEKYGISLENILDMEDCGLICSKSLFANDLLNKDGCFCFLAGNIAVCIKNKLESEEKLFHSYI